MAKHEEAKKAREKDSSVTFSDSSASSDNSGVGYYIHFRSGRLQMSNKDLWYLFFKVLPKLLVFPHSLQKKFQKDEHVHASLKELDTVVGVMPELPQDMLMVIFANLQIPDLIRADSVSSSWHAAYTSLRDLRQYKKSQMPCLLYASESTGENVACLYSLVEQREYKLTFPEPPIRSQFLIGSSNGWLITADETSELHLANPITGEQIALPSVITIKQVKPIFDDSGTINMYELSYHSGRAPEIYALNDQREHLYFKAFVFPDLSTGSYIVVLIHNPYHQLSFARAGDDKWNLLLPNTRYRDCVCMDGLLYALTSLGEIHAYDLTASTVTMNVIMDRVKFIHESMYIIPAPWGDLLQVWRIVDHPVNAPEQEDERVRYITKKIIVYKVDMAAKELVKINSLPHHMLFLGHNQTLCLGAAEHPQLKVNHAYFTDDHEELIMLLKNHTRDIGVLNLENSTRKEIVSQICSNWPCPTWTIPNLAKMNLAFSK
ncbi:putative F-box protein At4g22180 [Phragmites australis]|uniref:putative F-box protein At4g22180 n=1 Tax=Phragmites australis TaxID=29695 RepID=UPI002D764C49|nr:putative F-box protein At4g22180 [Phragmites australis]